MKLVFNRKFLSFLHSLFQNFKFLVTHRARNLVCCWVWCLEWFKVAFPIPSDSCSIKIKNIFSVGDLWRSHARWETNLGEPYREFRDCHCGKYRTRKFRWFSNGHIRFDKLTNQNFTWWFYSKMLNLSQNWIFSKHIFKWHQNWWLMLSTTCHQYYCSGIQCNWDYEKNCISRSHKDY